MSSQKSEREDFVVKRNAVAMTPESRTQEFSLRQGTRLNIYAGNDSVMVWANGPVELSVNNDAKRISREAGERLRFGLGGTIHALPLDRTATILFLKRVD
jgi:hypothetical protein